MSWFGPAGVPGSTVVVTGAAGGIGRAVVGLLTGAGARVAALDRDEAGLAGLDAGPGTVLPLTVDVRDPAAVEDAFAELTARLGEPDALIAAAGVLRPGGLLDITDDDWRESFAVNATGLFATVRAAARRMVPRRRGAIVAVTSNAAEVPRQRMAAYGPSKAAASMVVRNVGLEVAPHGVRCNVVAPGSTDTAMHRALWPELPGDEVAARSVAGDPDGFRPGIPLGRIATPDDIADAAVFLISDRARHITMQTIYVDGGAGLRG